MGLEADFKDSQTLAWGVEPSQCEAVRWAVGFFLGRRVGRAGRGRGPAG